MVNPARLQDAPGRAERALNHPERFVNISDGFLIVIRAAAQHEEPVIALVRCDEFFIDGKAACPLGFQEPQEAFVSGQAIVSNF